MRETLEELLDLPLKEGELENAEFLDGIGKKNITVQQALLVKQIQKALNGETDSFKIINEILNNKNEIRFK